MNSKLFIAFILSAGLLLFPSGCKKKTPTLKIGDPAPEITLQYDDGSTVGLQEIIKGKLAVILFWEKGCPYCEREMPKLEPLFKKYQDKGVILAGIHVGAEAEAVQEAVKQNSLTFPMLVDNNASSREIFWWPFRAFLLLIATELSVKRYLADFRPKTWKDS